MKLISFQKKTNNEEFHFFLLSGKQIVRECARTETKSSFESFYENTNCATEFIFNICSNFGSSNVDKQSQFFANRKSSFY